MQTPFKQYGRLTIASGSVGRIRRRYPVADTLPPSTGTTAKVERAAERDLMDAQALRAFASNGFGDVEVSAAPLHSLPDSFELHKQARARRSKYLRELVSGAARALADWFRAALARWQRKQDARGTFLALSGLDARTLRDLGLHRSEIMSVATEFAGDADSSRVRFTPVRHVTT